MNRMYMLFALVLVIVLPAAAPTANAQSGECFPAPEGLVAWWPGDGDAVDVIGGHDGIPQNGAAFAAGLVDQAFSLDGIDDYVMLPDSSNWNFGTGDFTVDFWVISSNAGNRMHPLSFEPAYGSRNLDFDFNDSFALWVYWNSSGVNRIRVGTPGAYSDGLWHLIALTRSGNTLTLYVDGLVVGSTSYSSPLDLSISTRNYIGAGQAGNSTPSFFWDGLVDEVEIFDRALATSEIQAIYDAGAAGKCKDEDGDGFRPPEDCNEADATINPEALEVPFNFVDENCDGNLGDCDPCAIWENHGHYVRCVAQVVSDCSTNNFTPEEANQLVQSAAQSDIGKKGFVPPECQ